MIKEAFCSSEVSKLLREKGFDEPCTSKYCTDGSFDRSFHHYKNSEINKDAYSAPTHQMAMAWLREMYGIYIVFFHTRKSGWWYNITDMDTSYVLFSSEKTQCYYDDIVDAALKYILKNLI